MENQVEQNIKKNGIIYTPESLGNYIARGIVDLLPKENYEPLKIIDPSVGDGELLKSIYIATNNLNIKTELWGVDTDNSALERAKQKLDTIGASVHLVSDDFLSFTTRTTFQDFFDIIISNPPYVSTQTMGKEDASKLAYKFGLKGKIDLYQAFYVSLSNILKPKGHIGIITSNKFMFNKTGSILRKHLLNEYDISKVVDLGDTKLFSASVLPAIVFGTKKELTFDITEKNETNFLKIYSKVLNSINDIKKVDSIYEILELNKSGMYEVNNNTFELTKGIVQFPSKPGDVWNFATNQEYKWAQNIEKLFPKKVLDVGKIRVGVKTTADNVFIDGLQDLDIKDLPESELIYNLITASSISKWTIGNSYKKILYPHIKGENKKADVINLENFPKAKSYLLKFYNQLSSRSYINNAGRKWYEIWVPQDPKMWAKPKIVFPDISEKPRFAYDNSGKLVAGNAYWFSLNEGLSPDWNYLILGIANSHIMEKYHDIKFQNKLYSGKRRYISQYVEQYPIPDIDSHVSRVLINTVKKVLAGESEASEVDKILDTYIEHNCVINYEIV